MRIREDYRTETNIKKSRFITCLSRTKNEEEARNFIAEIRKEFPDATHVCTAFVIGENRDLRRSSDNGEPAGTAGMPMLEALVGSGITDITACVVRYFGGVKLGTGGLVRAYGSCVSQAASQAPKTVDLPMDIYEIRYPYSMQGSLETWLRRNGTITDVMYDDAITVLYETTKKDIPQNVRDLSHGDVEPKFLRSELIEKDYLSEPEEH